MLYPQIPKKILDKIAAELDIDLGLLKVTLKEKHENEKTLFDKVNLVTRYIENHCGVGTMDSPKEFFKGTLNDGSGNYLNWYIIFITRFSLTPPFHSLHKSSYTDP